MLDHDILSYSSNPSPCRLSRSCIFHNIIKLLHYFQELAQNLLGDEWLCVFSRFGIV